MAHLGEFGSVEHIAQAKSEIVRGLLNDGVTVLNADDARVTRMQDIAPGKVVWFGIEHAQVHEHDGYVAADDISLDDLGHPVFTLVSEAGVEQRVKLGITGRHNIMNALAAASVARLEGMPLEHIAAVLNSVHAISAHRMAVSVVQEGDVKEISSIRVPVLLVTVRFSRICAYVESRFRLSMTASCTSHISNTLI